MNKKSEVAIKKKKGAQYYCNPVFPGHHRLRAIMTTIIVITDRLSLAHPAHHCVPYPWTFKYLSLVLGAPPGHLPYTRKTHLSAHI